MSIQSETPILQQLNAANKMYPVLSKLVQWFEGQRSLNKLDHICLEAKEVIKQIDDTGGKWVNDLND